MRPTLLKFVDEANVPKRYGGTLDWKFGDMPSLEPAIANNLHWPSGTAKHELPTGPIRWQYDSKGDLQMVAVGTNDGVQRNDIIATLHPDATVARLALKPGHADPAETPANFLPSAEAAVAVATPTVEHTPVIVEPATTTKGEPVPSTANGDIPPTANGAGVGAGAGAEAFDIPYRNDKHEIASPPVDARDGTSNTRFEQQADTHAEGQLAPRYSGGENRRPGISSSDHRAADGGASAKRTSPAQPRGGATRCIGAGQRRCWVCFGECRTCEWRSQGEYRCCSS